MKELQIPEIVDLASAFYGSAVLFAALDAGVFAAIEKAGGETADLPALAAATGASERGLRMLLDACVAVGILAKDPATGAWRNTQAGRLALVPGAPADLSRAIAYNRDVYPAWGRLGQFVRTHASVFVEVTPVDGPRDDEVAFIIHRDGRIQLDRLPDPAEYHSDAGSGSW